MSTNIFNPQRQSLFVQRQFWLYQHRWLMAAAVIVGLAVIFSALHILFNPAGNAGTIQAIRQMHNALFFIGGIILTSQIFLELHYPNRSYSFLSLPASTLDKLTGSWLLTSPLYILAFGLISFVIHFATFLLAGIPYSFSYFFTESYGTAVSNYLVIQTIFLWGACYFRKNNLLKTLLAMIVLFIVVGIFTISLLWVFFGGGTAVHISSPNFQNFLESGFATLMQIFFWALGPYMLLMSYFTLKERQV